MSTHNASPDPGPHGEQAEDRIDFSKVVAVGVVSLVIFALASGWAISILHSEQAALKNRGEGRMTSELGKSEIGIVDQVPFDSDVRLTKWKKERSDWLTGYGWIDRPHGLIHIPIERAMDEVIAGASPPAPPVPSVAPPSPTAKAPR